MLRSIDDCPQYESYAALVKELKWRYRRTHPQDVEHLHFEFVDHCNADGRSGFLKVERLEPSPSGKDARPESLLIVDNRVVGHIVEEPHPVLAG